MTLAHVNKYYLETNLMAALPSSHLDSLYADLQVHALDVSDGLAKVQTTLGTDMLTTVMGPDRYRSNYSNQAAVDSLLASD